MIETGQPDTSKDISPNTRCTLDQEAEMAEDQPAPNEHELVMVDQGESSHPDKDQQEKDSNEEDQEKDDPQEGDQHEEVQHQENQHSKPASVAEADIESNAIDSTETGSHQEEGDEQATPASERGDIVGLEDIEVQETDGSLREGAELQLSDKDEKLQDNIEGNQEAEETRNDIGGETGEVDEGSDTVMEKSAESSSGHVQGPNEDITEEVPDLEVEHETQQESLTIEVKLQRSQRDGDSAKTDRVAVQSKVTIEDEEECRDESEGEKLEHCGGCGCSLPPALLVRVMLFEAHIITILCTSRVDKFTYRTQDQ